MAKTVSKSFLLSNSSKKLPFFAVLMYALYGHPRYFKWPVFRDYLSVSYDYAPIYDLQVLAWYFKKQSIYFNRLAEMHLKPDTICLSGGNF